MGHQAVFMSTYDNDKPQGKVSSEILHKGSVGPQGIEVHEVGTVGIEELRNA
ncbi:unnamed protein product [Prunus brigantina]